MAATVKFHGTRQRLVGGGLPFFGLAGGTSGGGGGDPTALWNVDIVEGATTVRTDQPFSFGLPLGPGQFDSATQKIVVYDGETALTDAQYTCECVDQDGDVRWVRVDGIIPSLSSGSTKTLSVKAESGSQAAGTAITPAELAAFIASNATGGGVRIKITYGGVDYFADAADILDDTKTTYDPTDAHHRADGFAGPMAACYVGSAPFKDVSSNLFSNHKRVDFSIYGWRRSSDSAIVAARVDAVVWNSAYDPASNPVTNPPADPTEWGDINLSGLAIEWGDGTAINSYGAVTAYGRSSFGFVDGDAVWIGLSGAEKGAWEPVHENVSGKLQKAMENGWLHDMYGDSAHVGGQISSWDSSLTANGITPFQSKGNHANYHMGGTGARYEIGYITFGQSYGVRAWSDAKARRVVKQNLRESLHIPWRWVDQNTGVLVSMTETAPNTTTSTAPSPKATPWDSGGNSLDVGHQPNDAIVPYMLYGDFWMLQALHVTAHYVWMASTLGSGYNRRLSAGMQDRGSAWAMRTIGGAAALTPNAMSAGRTGVARSHLQQWLDSTVGASGGTVTFGLYHGAQNQSWGSPAPLSGLFDNTLSPPVTYRWIPHSGGYPMRMWGGSYYATAMTFIDRLKVGNADFNSYLTWMGDLLEQLLQDPRWPMAIGLYGRLGRDSGEITYPISVDDLYSDLARTLEIIDNNKPWDSNLFLQNSSDLAQLGITGIQATYSTTDAITLQLQGVSAIDYFTDGGSSWFEPNGGDPGCVVALEGSASTTAQLAVGHITSVVNGKTVVVDFQSDANGVNVDPTRLTSGEILTAGDFRLPAPSKTASWLSTATIIGTWSSDYPPLVLGAIETLAASGFNSDTLAQRRTDILAVLEAKGRVADAGNFPQVGDGNAEWWYRSGT